MTQPIHFHPAEPGSEWACLGNIRIGLVCQQDSGPAWWRSFFGEPTTAKTALGMTLAQARKALLDHLAEAFDAADQAGLACLTREQARVIASTMEQAA